MSSFYVSELFTGTRRGASGADAQVRIRLVPVRVNEFTFWGYDILWPNGDRSEFRTFGFLTVPDAIADAKKRLTDAIKSCTLSIERQNKECERAESQRISSAGGAAVAADQAVESAGSNQKVKEQTK